MLKWLFFSYFNIISYIVIAFRFVGRPGHYVYVFDGYRMEEVSTYEKTLSKKRYVYSVFQWIQDNKGKIENMLKQHVKSST